MTWVPTEGEPTIPGTLPELPAAATTIAPARAALEAAVEVGSSGWPKVEPRLMLMTCATGLGKPVRVRGETESSSARMMRSPKQPPMMPTPRTDPGMLPMSEHTL
jgi:hypothetical protein